MVENPDIGEELESLRTSLAAVAGNCKLNERLSADVALLESRVVVTRSQRELLALMEPQMESLRVKICAVMSLAHMEKFKELQNVWKELSEAMKGQEQLLSDAIAKAKGFWTVAQSCERMVAALNAKLETFGIQTGVDVSNVAQANETEQDSTKNLAEEKKDRFSILPKDCLLAVFSFVDRNTLDALECVSKAIREVATDDSLRGIKREGALHIYERLAGYSFVLNYPHPKNKTVRSVSYFVNPEAPYNEKGTRSCHDTTYYCSYHHDIPDNKYPGDQTTIPTIFFDNLCKLLKNNYSSCIYLEWIMFDNDFLERFSTTLKEKAPNELIFHNVLFEESLNLERFIAFIQSMNLSCLEFWMKEQDLPDNLGDILALFDESFLTSFASATQKDRPKFEITFTEDQYDEVSDFWNPTDEFFLLLIRFEKLELITMTFTTEELINMALMRMEEVENEAEWRFTVTDDLTEAHLERIDTEKYKLYSSFQDDNSDTDELDSFDVTRISTEFQFYYRQQYNTSYGCIVQVYFEKYVAM